MRINGTSVRTAIPWAMAAARAAMGPLLAVGAAYQWSGLALAGMVLAALLSDIFDGILARRWQCDTAAVRLFDTLADTFFYAWVAVALWLAAPDVWRQNAALLVAVLALEALHFAFDLVKFGKPASYHSYLAKTWGLVLAAAVMTVFVLGRSHGLMTIALWLGIACKLEGLTMSALLRTWHRDVKTLRAAWRIRNRQMANQRISRPARLAWFANLALGVLLLSHSALAIESSPAVTRRLGASCPLTEQKAVHSLEEHDFYTSTRREKSGDTIQFGNLKMTSLPSGKPLSFNRFSIHKYALPRHLSPLKSYDDFRLEGELRLEESDSEFCTATLTFKLSAYEFAWPLAVIDDGYRSGFVSNGALERIYLGAVEDLVERAR